MTKFCLQFVSLSILVGLGSACSHSDDTTPIPELSSTVTADNYLSGKKFCETYGAITKKEHGRYVRVPKNYNSPDADFMDIYVYTMSPFDPSKPSYIYVDGGPGQNTHGEMPDLLNGQMNEFRFDQRGLGCSAPDTFWDYTDATNYSTMNNVRDIEEIRKSFGIEHWSVYGVSYGTVPATMYGNLFSQNVTSIVLEGVASGGDLNKIASDFRIQKYNTIWNMLNTYQKITFAKLIEDENYRKVILYVLDNLVVYSDDANNKAHTLFNKLIHEDGTADYAELDGDVTSVKSASAPKAHPQAPGEVDQRIFLIIECKNLGLMQSQASGVRFSPTKGFAEGIQDSSDTASACSEVGVDSFAVDTYTPANYPIIQPVYYFQGQLDGATPLTGAVEHWKKVPQGKAYFLLAQLGGHNPNLTRIGAKNNKNYAKGAQESIDELILFSHAILGQDILPDDISLENDQAPSDQKWMLYLPHQEIPLL